MKTQISNISVNQTSKVVGLLYFVISAIILIPVGIIYLVSGKQEEGSISAIVFFLLPVVYFIAGYIGMAILSFFYNLIARSFGGFEFTLSEKDKIV